MEACNKEKVWIWWIKSIYLIGIILAVKPVGWAVFDADAAVVFVELFYELHGLLRVLKVCVVNALLVEVGDKRAVKVEMVVKPVCEMLFVKIVFYYSSINTNK